MKTRDEAAAAQELAAYTDEDTALNMVKTARYVAERGRRVPVCTSARDTGIIVSISYDRGWWELT
jgi:hypothetical protein